LIRPAIEYAMIRIADLGLLDKSGDVTLRAGWTEAEISSSTTCYP
jgi:hypothetical protein